MLTGPFPFVPGGRTRRRKPNNLHFPVPILYSPFHPTSDICATCHDGSNLALTRQSYGSYALNPLGVAHDTQDKYDMFPIERTFSEWANSLYASMGVQANGVFGGNHPTGVMHTCQDCHMPKADTYGCALEVIRRPDVPAHDFNGGNAWVQDMLYNLYPFTLTYEYLADSKAWARYMLENASTLEVTNKGCAINVRIVNETGHATDRLSEGRRMWINVELRRRPTAGRRCRGVRRRHGGVDLIDTKVTRPSWDWTRRCRRRRVPAGTSFHFVLNNKVYSDNRIPPRGFIMGPRLFRQRRSRRPLPTVSIGMTRSSRSAGRDGALVSVYHQTATKEYIEFLRDENRTNTAGDGRGCSGRSRACRRRCSCGGSRFLAHAGPIRRRRPSGLSIWRTRLLGDCVMGPN